MLELSDLPNAVVLRCNRERLHDILFTRIAETRGKALQSKSDMFEHEAVYSLP